MNMYCTHVQYAWENVHEQNKNHAWERCGIATIISSDRQQQQFTNLLIKSETKLSAHGQDNSI